MGEKRRCGRTSTPDIAIAAQTAGSQAAAAVADPLKSMLCGRHRRSEDHAPRPGPAPRRVRHRGPRRAGVPPVVRDEFQMRRFPDDEYGLTPASLARPRRQVGDLALAWGAAKALEPTAVATRAETLAIGSVRPATAEGPSNRRTKPCVARRTGSPRDIRTGVARWRPSGTLELLARVRRLHDVVPAVPVHRHVPF